MEEVIHNVSTDTIIKTMENLPFSEDPIVQFFKWLGLIAIVVAFAAKPIMLYIRSFKQDRVDNAANEAHADLFEKLNETIKVQRETIIEYDAKFKDLYSRMDAMRNDDTALKMENERLRMRLEKMELISNENARLRERLNQKDEKIKLLVMEIDDLKERIKQLETRLSADEVLVGKSVADIREEVKTTATKKTTKKTTKK